MNDMTLIKFQPNSKQDFLKQIDNKIYTYKLQQMEIIGHKSYMTKCLNLMQ